MHLTDHLLCAAEPKGDLQTLIDNRRAADRDSDDTKLEMPMAILMGLVITPRGTIHPYYRPESRDTHPSARAWLRSGQRRKWAPLAAKAISSFPRERNVVGLFLFHEGLRLARHENLRHQVRKQGRLSRLSARDHRNVHVVLDDQPSVTTNATVQFFDELREPLTGLEMQLEGLGETALPEIEDWLAAECDYQRRAFEGVTSRANGSGETLSPGGGTGLVGYWVSRNNGK